MSTQKPSIIIAGAGGIARAIGLILAEWSDRSLRIAFGNRTLRNAENAEVWIRQGTSAESDISAFHLPEEPPYPKTMTKEMEKAAVLIDCLPGAEAPRMARLAMDHDLHYLNLTEYVAETKEIRKMASGSSRGFILQTGLAPGYINVLAHKLFRDFCSSFEVDTVDSVLMRVGALTEHALPPAFYGFTWSPVGVATEYLKPAIVIRNGESEEVPSLSSRESLRIHNLAYEADLTSGGASDLPVFLAGKVDTLNYKTLRYPGHYDWIRQQIEEIGDSTDRVRQLQRRMERVIPQVEEDIVVIYAAVQGRDAGGNLRRLEKAHLLRPLQVGSHTLRAIQCTTAAPPAELALDLLDARYSGVVLQSGIEPQRFLQGDFVTRVYG